VAQSVDFAGVTAGFAVRSADIAVQSTDFARLTTGIAVHTVDIKIIVTLDRCTVLKSSESGLLIDVNNWYLV